MIVWALLVTFSLVSFPAMATNEAGKAANTSSAAFFPLSNVKTYRGLPKVAQAEIVKSTAGTEKKEQTAKQAVFTDTLRAQAIREIFDPQ